ncbi:MAG: hypothetical protein WEB19_03850 [Acidimicrobiia bacterium]
MVTSSRDTGSRFARLMVPATTAGRWCLASFTFGVLGFITMVVSVSSGQEGGDTFTDNWWISGPALFAALGLVGAFITGLFAIVGSRERAAAVFLVTVIGAIVTLFMVGEILTPH